MANSKIDDVVYSYATDLSQLEEENRVLKETVENLREEITKLKQAPLMVCELKDIIGKNAIVKIPNGSSFFVNISEDCEKILPGDTVLAEQKNLNVIKKIPTHKTFDVEKFVIIDKPNVKWDMVGGLKRQVEEIKEVIELPLKKPKLFKKVGIDPPKGILLHGPPGTGKTLLAKAVASSTKSTFIEIVGSELVQKFIGEGAKLVKEVFDLAREKAPSVVFIDELDALAATRIDVGTSGEREVQRTFMQLLAEIDGFKSLDNVKIIGCTNRRDILDPAILRPGRLDRHIKVDIPGDEGRQEILRIHTKKMKLDSKCNLKKIVSEMKEFSGAEIHAACTEAGYFAIRENRTKVKKDDFTKAVKKVKEEENLLGQDYLKMFG
ncbi:MAG: AAA family ATPase [Candidatus Woesearchaeota archaeon]|jgi:proteasome regulatory subunit|nr:AAA family ATPase [Candidatus Woesearchaeota archaeon]MDP7323513.1 AAA family ATPase [Candidatus Woesearchaeota archaeon]MDP7457506.1 AAA family ATPase [Candidatus Woesearchaeota archaeon]